MMVSLMCARISRRNRSPASAKSDDRTTAVLSALASRLTAASARSLSFQSRAARRAWQSGGVRQGSTAYGERDQDGPREVAARAGADGKRESAQIGPVRRQLLLRPRGHDGARAVVR